MADLNLKYFNYDEFKCPCGKCNKGINNINQDSAKKLDQARAIAGVVFKINSSVRCDDHNISVGGKDDSSHLVGCAFDIAVNSSRNRYLIVDALILAGFNRIGIGKTFIHADDDPLKDEKVVWLY